MTTSFYNFDYYIEANEKRDTLLRAEYDKVLGRVSNIVIIYSAISVSLVSIIKDLFTFPFNFWYFTALLLFGIPFLISCFYAVRFLFPIVIPILIAPREYYMQLRLRLERRVLNGTELSDAQKEEINHRIKTSYLEELEEAVANSTILFFRKRDYYQRALRFAIYSIFPFIICLIFHFIYH